MTDLGEIIISALSGAMALAAVVGLAAWQWKKLRRELEGRR